MQQIVSQVLRFLQTGIEAIFRFVDMIWTWSVHQVTKLVEVPWQDWPVLMRVPISLQIWPQQAQQPSQPQHD